MLRNMTINNLLKEIKQNKLAIDTDLIQRAYKFACKAHQGQRRESGEEYINHSLNTALTLARMKLDAPTIAAALLHDVVDDTSITLQDIKKEFGGEITSLVKGVCKLGKIKYRGIERHVENLRKMFLAMAKDIRIILIKLADRLHNMKTLDALPERKQKRIAQETLEIYTPIAHRLGIGKLKGDLEDLAFPYAYPKEYKWLKNKIKDRYQERECYLKKIQPLVKEELKKAGITPIEIHYRAKHYFSLYQKLRRYSMDFSKIYDLMALRIIVQDIKECYAALGVIHKNWSPVPGRIRDYIAVPKANGYQSLHTTVFCAKGKITEFQIRTSKIHWEAEFGIAAHWMHGQEEAHTKFYEIKKAQTDWIKELKKWQKDVVKPKEFLESLKIFFFKYRIFVLTPKGEVVNLPEGATPVDFAYQIHTELGHRCGGAIVDGKIVPLNYPLFNAQMVEILAKKEPKPSQDWLKFVKTNYAKSKIKAWFKEREEKPEIKKRPVKKEKVEPRKEIIVKYAPKKIKNLVTINKENGLVIKLAKCCNPLPGEPITSYVTTLGSITVHHHQCHNIINKKEKRRILPVSWKNAVAPQLTTVEILARDRIGLVKDITTVLSKLRINITNLNASEPSKDIALALITMEVVDVNQLCEAQKKLKEIKGVWEAKRI